MNIRTKPQDDIIPSAVGDIHVPHANSKLPVDTSFEFVPQNPYTMEAHDESIGKLSPNRGFTEYDKKSGFFNTAWEEFKELSTNYKVMHASYNSTANFLEQPTNSNWNPKLEVEKLSNIDDKFVPYLLDAKNPQDMQYRHQAVVAEQQHDANLANGSFFAKVVGGLFGLSPVGSIESLIPIAGMASKAKVSASAISGFTKAYPGMLTASAIRSAANQMDKTEGNMHDFITDTFVDSVFGATLFGGIGAVKSGLNLSEMNRLNEFSKNYLKGINFDWVLNEKGEVEGFKAIDSTGGSLSAATVSKAQEMADSAFYKGGVFKIPYVGEGVLKLVSGNIPVLSYFTGSPLVAGLNSKYNSVRSFVDRGFDHFITTKGVAEGGVKPKSFEFFMKKEWAGLRELHLQTTALHMERNGYKNQRFPLFGLWNYGKAAVQRGIETVSKETDKTSWITKDAFMDEVQQVLFSGQSSEHAAVNELAGMYREKIDSTWKAFREAYGLPEDWMPPKTAEAYLMRVYDTAYLNANENQWIEVVSNYLKEADETIAKEMMPINQAKQAVKTHQEAHDALIKSGKATNEQVGNSARELEALQRKSKKLEDDLSNKLRSDGNLHLHVDDHTALTANEAKQVRELLKPVNEKQQVVDSLQKEVDELKKQSLFETGKARKARTAEKAEEKMQSAESAKILLAEKEEALRIAKIEVEDAEDLIQQKAINREISPHLYTKIPNSNRIKLKDPSNRIKLRDIYESHDARIAAAKAYYNSIMNMTPEDTIADLMGRITGNVTENVLKKRSLMIPDKILYDNNFMTKDLFAKTSNYVNYLSRRTHMKNSFSDITLDGGFDEIGQEFFKEYEANRELINQKIAFLENKLQKKDKLEPKKVKELETQLAKAKKDIKNEAIDFERNKELMRNLYETRMMGINKRSKGESMARSVIMNITSAANLHNLPATQITDIAAIGFQHGVWPFVRDAVYPIIESLGGLMKTKDSEALRKTAPSLHLGLQDQLAGFADKSWSMEMQPYLNMGKIVSGIEKISHFTANSDLSTFIDNGIQHMAGATIQSEFMRMLHEQVAGTLSKADSLYLRKYGIDPEKWANRMVKAYEEGGGFKTAVGGYQSNFWKWQDLEASNEFGDAVFRGIQNTLIQRGMADSPFFADNILGMFFHTFTGWGFAAVNRYLIPTMQHPEAKSAIGMLWMMAAGSLVSPMRRISRGEEPWPEDMTDTQRFYEAFADSGVLSSMANTLSYANFLSNDTLLGKLKNDKWTQRSRVGALGAVWSTGNRIADVLAMAATGEWNEKDMKTAAKMLPISGAMYGHVLSNKLIEGLQLPQTRRAAQSE